MDTHIYKMVLIKRKNTSWLLWRVVNASNRFSHGVSEGKGICPKSAKVK